MEKRWRSRREYLAVAGTIGFVGLAGCGDDESTTDQSTDDDTEAQSDNKEGENADQSSDDTVEQNPQTEEPDIRISLPGELTVGEEFTGTFTIRNNGQSAIEPPEVSVRSESDGQVETLSTPEDTEISPDEREEVQFGPIVPLYNEDLNVVVGQEEATKSVGTYFADGQDFQADNGLNISFEPIALYEDIFQTNSDELYSPDTDNFLLQVDVSIDGWNSVPESDQFTFATPGIHPQNNISIPASDIELPGNPYEGGANTESGGWVLFEVRYDELEGANNFSWKRNANTDGIEVDWFEPSGINDIKAGNISSRVDFPNVVHRNEGFELTVDVDNPTKIPFTYHKRIELTGIEEGPTTLGIDETFDSQTAEQRAVGSFSPGESVDSATADYVNSATSTNEITVGPPRLEFGEDYEGITVEKADATGPLEYKQGDYTYGPSGSGTLLKISTNGISPSPEEFHAVDLNNTTNPSGTELYDLIHSEERTELLRPVEGEIYEQGYDSGWIVLDPPLELDLMIVGWFPETTVEYGTTIMEAEATWYSDEIKEYQDERDEYWWR